MRFKEIKVHKLIFGKTKGSDVMFMDRLKSHVNLREVHANQKRDLTIAFVPVVSRTGTDIQAALRNIPVNEHVVLVVLHHTFDVGLVVPHSGRCVGGETVLTVDCLYHEDQGLLTSQHNQKAVQEVTRHLISLGAAPKQQVLVFYVLLVLLVLLFFWIYI